MNLHLDDRDLRVVFGTYGISPSNWIEVKVPARPNLRDRHWDVLPDMAKLGHLGGSDGRYLAIVSPQSMSEGSIKATANNEIMKLKGVFTGAPQFDVSLDLAGSAEAALGTLARIVGPYGVRTGATRFHVQGLRYEIKPRSRTGLWFCLLHFTAASLA
ncbi:MAG: hypothetical protein HY554_04190 [Elusimicrobia bacterium]|nr:hypothetical protein [Elusimicrobiota bacterium]